MNKNLITLYKKLNKLVDKKVDPIVQADKDIEQIKKLCQCDAQVRILIQQKELQLKNRIKRKIDGNLCKAVG